MVRSVILPIITTVVVSFLEDDKASAERCEAVCRGTVSGRTIQHKTICKHW